MLDELLFKIIFSITVVLSISWMALAYGDALKFVSMLLIALVFVTVFLGFSATTPMACPDEIEVRDVVRITRHSAVLGLGLWGLGHFIVNGDVASHIFFGNLAFQGLIGPLNMDCKFRVRYGDAWETYCAKTSYLPFVAILSGRNRLVLREINWIAALGGLAVFALFLYFHTS